MSLNTGSESRHQRRKRCLDAALARLSYDGRRTLTRWLRTMTMQPRNSSRSWCVVNEDSVESTDATA